MRVSILAPDASFHTVPRTRLLAQALATRPGVELEVIAPVFHGDNGYDSTAWPGTYHAVAAHPEQEFRATAREMATRITGDVLYAMKPRPASFGVALWQRRKLGLPVVLDIDDWELFMVPPYSRHVLKNLLYSIPRLHCLDSCYVYYLLLDALARPGFPFKSQADGVTSVSRFFRTRYGGVRLPQGCDTDIFVPVRLGLQELRHAWGLEDFRVAVFAGTPQLHKGLGLVIDAIHRLARPDVRLLIAGPETPFTREIATDPLVRYVGMLPHERVPEFLSLADLVALPQRFSPYARGQMPLKLFEAMSTACPIVATAVSDIPETLDGCGLVVPPDDADALAQAMDSLLDDPDLARRLGDAAREKCLRDHSLPSLGLVLDSVLRRAISNQG
jgi:glycosyltransferase involved in cell wall biosynthesis